MFPHHTAVAPSPVGKSRGEQPCMQAKRCPLRPLSLAASVCFSPEWGQTQLPLHAMLSIKLTSLTVFWSALNLLKFQTKQRNLCFYAVCYKTRGASEERKDYKPFLTLLTAFGRASHTLSGPCPGKLLLCHLEICQASATCGVGMGKAARGEHKPTDAEPTLKGCRMLTFSQNFCICHW